jgi:hypothetical protein
VSENKKLKVGSKKWKKMNDIPDPAAVAAPSSGEPVQPESKAEEPSIGVYLGNEAAVDFDAAGVP